MLYPAVCQSLIARFSTGPVTKGRSISVDGFDDPLATVERKIAVPDDVSADVVRVSNWIDKQPGPAHGNEARGGG
jgi:hypothetical protein